MAQSITKQSQFVLRSFLLKIGVCPNHKLQERWHDRICDREGW